MLVNSMKSEDQLKIFAPASTTPILGRTTKKDHLKEKELKFFH